MTVLTVDQLHVDLGGRAILTGVNLQVNRGELMGLIGPNGAGKTTLMRAIMGLIPIRSGSIRLAEHTGCAWHEIGYVPQRQDMDFGYPISVEQMVATAVTSRRSIFSRMKVTDWARVYQALDKVDLFDLRKRTIAELSGGQRQRVLIARALATEPKLLLLDEPFTGLDHPNQDALSALFRRLAGEGAALIMSTHDLTQAVDISDRIAMLKGVITACDAPANLRDKQLWMDTYSVSEDSPLLRSVGLVK